jgi:hypothetical protein
MPAMSGQNGAPGGHNSSLFSLEHQAGNNHRGMVNRTMQEISLDEIFRMAADILSQIAPIFFAAIALGLGFQLLKNFFSPFGYSETSYDNDPRNYQLRKFDAMVEEIEKMSPPESILINIPTYRQSLEKTSEFNTEIAKNASAKILEGMNTIRDKLIEAKSIKAVSKSKAIIEDLTEQLAKLDDNLSALIEVKIK